MIALDTNILVRAIMGDDSVQTPQARALIERCTPEAPGFIGREVLVELAWVLSRRFRLSRAAVADALEGVLSTGALAVEAAEEATRALDAYRAGTADFADLMILAAAQRAGAETLATFDRDLGGQSGATFLGGQ